MKKGTFFAIIGAMTVCFLFVHRRVIKAKLNNEPMPKAPKWHCWVKPEDRRE